jgi:hypothetical protein
MKRSVIARVRGRAHPDGITIYPVERLGNQLFIYAAGLSQAHRLNVPCYVNCGFYQPGGPEKLYRKSYDLARFDSGLVVPESSDYHQPLIFGDPASEKGGYWYNKVAPKLHGAVSPVFREQTFTFDERINEVTSGTTLSGYFQSFKYFGEIADEIRTRILSPTTPSDWCLLMQRRITPGSGSVVLNLRRGGTQESRHLQFHGLVGRDYYVRSLNLLRRLGLDGPVYVASDSLDEAMGLLKGTGELIPIEPPPDVNPFDVLQLLARADGFVAANSTFSWWAGFLGDKEGHVVVAPRPWFTNGHVDTRDLLPPGWLTIDRE